MGKIIVPIVWSLKDIVCHGEKQIQRQIIYIMEEIDHYTMRKNNRTLQRKTYSLKSNILLKHKEE